MSLGKYRKEYKFTNPRFPTVLAHMLYHAMYEELYQLKMELHSFKESYNKNELFL